MNPQTKGLVRLILCVLKDVYQKTAELETVMNTNSQILSSDLEPFSELMQILNIPEDKQNELAELMEHYLNEEMTLDEIIIAFEMMMKAKITL